MEAITTLGILAGGAPGRSLGVARSPAALRLEEAIADGKIVLLQLDAGRLPEDTRQVGACVPRAMLRLLARA